MATEAGMAVEEEMAEEEAEGAVAATALEIAAENKGAEMDGGAIDEDAVMTAE